MDRRPRIILGFAVTLLLCVAISARMAEKGIFPDDYVFYALVIAAIFSFGFGVFTMIKNKLVASIVTVAGLLLLGLATFIAVFFQGNIGY